MKILRYLIIFLATILGIYLIIALFSPKTFHIERSVNVNASVEQVFPNVNHLDKWPSWSAWQARDPSIKYIYSGPKSGEGATVSWTSDKSGDGSMKITKVDPGKSITLDLMFMEDGTPTVATWLFDEKNGSTNITWVMDGQFGFFMRPMGLFFDQLAGKDFEQGLQNLKALCEVPGVAD